MSRMERATELLLPVSVTLICLTLIVPIVIVIVLAFSGQGYLRFPPESYSLRWFVAFFGDARWRAALWSSVEIAVIACAVATLVGFMAAYAFVRSPFRGKRLLLSAALLPVLAPTVITSLPMYF